MAPESIDINNYEDILKEVRQILSLMYPEDDFGLFDKAFYDIVSLFDGTYSGYRECNTPFHDLQHTMDCLLAMARIIHGAFVENFTFPAKESELGLISALMHDTGYIQTEDDIEGSGAKYTMVHVRRSADFLSRYFERNDIGITEAEFCIECIYYTGLGSEFDSVVKDGSRLSVMGQMLATADLVGQMADQAYLEKLPFLASEFREGSVPGYVDTDDLIKKTRDFYLKSKNLLKNEYGGVVKYLKSHFRDRWGIDRNVYIESIQKQIDYLERVIRKYPDRYLAHLRRERKQEDGPKFPVPDPE